MVLLVPVPGSGLIREKNDVIVARGAAGTGGIGAADSFGPLCDGAQLLPYWCPYRCMLAVNGIHQRAPP